MVRERMLLLAGAAALAICAAWPAMAADFYRAPVPKTELGLALAQGFYIGTEIGLGGNSADFSQLAGNTVLTTGKLGSIKPNAGVFAGFDIHLNSLVIGAEVGGSYINSEIRSAVATAEPDYKSDWMATASLRVGALITPSTLLYAKGGYAYIDVQAQPGGLPTESGNVQGFQAGGGIEAAVAPHVSARVEALYTKAVTAFEYAGVYHYQPEFLTVRVGASFRPGNGEERLVPETVERNWTGIYAGGQAGGTVATADVAVFNGVQTVGTASDIEFSGGGFAGFNWQPGKHWVVGLEADGTVLRGPEWGEADLSLFLGPVAKADWMTSVDARVGYLVTPSTMVYGKAGWSLTHFVADPSFGPNDAQLVHGIQAGAGIETLLSQHIFARVEGLYTAPFDQVVFNGLGSPIFLDPRFLTGRAGLGVLF